MPDHDNEQIEIIERGGSYLRRVDVGNGRSPGSSKLCKNRGRRRKVVILPIKNVMKISGSNNSLLKPPISNAFTTGLTISPQCQNSHVLPFQLQILEQHLLLSDKPLDPPPRPFPPSLSRPFEGQAARYSTHGDFWRDRKPVYQVSCPCRNLSSTLSKPVLAEHHWFVAMAANILAAACCIGQENLCAHRHQ